MTTLFRGSLLQLLAAMAFGQFLAGCVTFPGELARPDYVARIVDREYSVTWNTLVAALRNEGAALQAADKQAGIIETAYSSRPGTKVRTRGPFVHVDTQSVQVRVRYSVRANPLGSERTEVRLRTEVQYQDGAKGWVATTDDGGVAESFWRRFHQDLAYYGLRPETWGAQEPRRDPGPSGPTAPGDPEGRAGGAPSGR